MKYIDYILLGIGAAGVAYLMWITLNILFYFI